MVDAHYYVIKLGGRGAYIYDGKYYFCLPAFDVKAVDTTAAGDAFTSALTLEYLRCGDIERAGRYANLVGAMTVGRAALAADGSGTQKVCKDIRNKDLRRSAASSEGSENNLYI